MSQAVESELTTYEKMFVDGSDGFSIEQNRSRLVNAAVLSHLEALGKHQHVDIDYIGGRTSVSVVNYFRKAKLRSNPVNEVALTLPPRFSYQPGYADSTYTSEDWSGLYNVEKAMESSDALKAARKGSAAEFIVGMALGVQRENKVDWGLRYIADAVIRDKNEQVVGELSDLAARFKDKGYVDFLDYLIDTKELIEGRVDTIFEHGPPTNIG